MACISASVVTAQSALTEKDNVISLIRLVDTFLLPTLAAEQMANLPRVAMTMYINIIMTSDDSGEHSISFTLTRPDGESKTHILLEHQIAPPAKFGGKYRSMALVGPLGIEPKQFGLHRIDILLDEACVASTFFTLVSVSEGLSPQTS